MTTPQASQQVPDEAFKKWWSNQGYDIQVVEVYQNGLQCSFTSEMKEAFLAGMKWRDEQLMNAHKIKCACYACVLDDAKRAHGYRHTCDNGCST